MNIVLQDGILSAVGSGNVLLHSWTICPLSVLQDQVAWLLGGHVSDKLSRTLIRCVCISWINYLSVIFHKVQPLAAQMHWMVAIEILL